MLKKNFSFIKSLRVSYVHVFFLCVCMCVCVCCKEREGCCCCCWLLLNVKSKDLQNSFRVDSIRNLILISWDMINVLLLIIIITYLYIFITVSNNVFSFDMQNFWTFYKAKFVEILKKVWERLSITDWHRADKNVHRSKIENEQILTWALQSLALDCY